MNSHYQPKGKIFIILLKVRQAVTQSGITDGACIVYCPHTTAGITINENADPDVVYDMLLGLDNAFPHMGGFRHMEGNSSAHLKASCLGASETVIISGESLYWAHGREYIFVSLMAQGREDFT